MTTDIFNIILWIFTNNPITMLIFGMFIPFLLIVFIKQLGGFK